MANLKEMSIKNPLVIGGLVVGILAVIVGLLFLLRNFLRAHNRNKLDKDLIPTPAPAPDPAQIKALPEILDDQIKDVLSENPNFLNYVEEFIRSMCAGYVTQGTYNINNIGYDGYFKKTSMKQIAELDPIFNDITLINSMLYVESNVKPFNNLTEEHNLHKLLLDRLNHIKTRVEDYKKKNPIQKPKESILTEEEKKILAVGWENMNDVQFLEGLKLMKYLISRDSTTESKGPIVVRADSTDYEKINIVGLTEGDNLDMINFCKKMNKEGVKNIFFIGLDWRKLYIKSENYEKDKSENTNSFKEHLIEKIDGVIRQLEEKKKKENIVTPQSIAKEPDLETPTEVASAIPQPIQQVKIDDKKIEEVLKNNPDFLNDLNDLCAKVKNHSQGYAMTDSRGLYFSDKYDEKYKVIIDTLKIFDGEFAHISYGKKRFDGSIYECISLKSEYYNAFNGGNLEQFSNFFAKKLDNIIKQVENYQERRPNPDATTILINDNGDQFKTINNNTGINLS